MENSKIEWCDHTFNPWEGCTKVSPGCVNCYAEARDKRFNGGVHWGKGVRRRTTAKTWEQPLKWNRMAASCGTAEGSEKCPVCSGPSGPHRPRVFCASLGDWLDDEVPIEWLVDFLDLARICQNLDFLLLTKRPELWSKRIEAALNWIEAQPSWGADDKEWPRYELRNWLADWFVLWKAPANVWIGTTVEDQPRADERIPALLKIPAKVRFLSVEPLLGPVDFRKVPGFNKAGSAGVEMLRNFWVICGGESGHGARPLHPDWARSLRDQCATAGVPFFFKQWGEWSPRKWCKDGGTHAMHKLAPGYGVFQEIQSHPDSVERVGAADGWQAFAKVGKKAAGRLLDGVEHNGFPNVEVTR